jgi:hypothetical protein
MHPKLINALRAFSRDQASSSRQLPSEIALQDLVRGGYLTTKDVQAFEGMDVTFNTQADDTRSQMILARARTPDGQFICLLADVASSKSLHRDTGKRSKTLVN